MKRGYEYEFKGYERNKKLKKHKKRERKIRAKDNSESSSSSYSDDELNCSFDFKDDVFTKENRIYFKAKVSQTSVEKLITIINEKNKNFKDLIYNNRIIAEARPNPIYLHITSYGGCLFSGFRAVDAIVRSEIPIYTVVDGHAASAATLMSVVGKRRFMTPNSYLLIHQLSSGAWGTYWNIKDEYKNCKSMMDKIYKIYEEHTNMDKTEVKKQLCHDSWWDTEKCLNKEIIDEVYEEAL